MPEAASRESIGLVSQVIELQRAGDRLHDSLQRHFASAFQEHTLKSDSQQRTWRSLAVGLGLGHVADDFCVSRDHNLTVHQYIGRGPGLDFGIGLGFLRVQRLRQLDGENGPVRQRIGRRRGLRAGEAAS